MRSAALHALEGSADPRAADAALAALADPADDVVVAAIGVLRGRVAGEDGVRALDALTAVALDAWRTTTVRQASLEALAELPHELVAPVLEAANAALRASGNTTPGTEEPLDLHAWISAHGAAAPLSTLHDLIARARARAEADPRRLPQWLAARGAAHLALARRGSPVALYDLREAFAGARAPLPLDFLTAITEIGDATCLEPMASAWAAIPAEEAWWRDRLAEAGRAIVRQRRLGPRSAVLRRLRASVPDFV